MTWWSAPAQPLTDRDRAWGVLGASLAMYPLWLLLTIGTVTESFLGWVFFAGYLGVIAGAAAFVGGIPASIALDAVTRGASRAFSVTAYALVGFVLGGLIGGALSAFSVVVVLGGGVIGAVGAAAGRIAADRASVHRRRWDPEDTPAVGQPA